MLRKIPLIVFLFLAVAFSLSAKSKPDTTDHWTVFYNKQQLAKLEPSSHNKLIVIKPQRILPDDLLSLDYWCDAPCDDCKTSLYMDSEKRIQLAKTRGSMTKLSVNLVKLFNAWRDCGMKPVGVYYNDGHRE